MAQLEHMIRNLLSRTAIDGDASDQAEARELLAHLETYKPAHDSKVVRFADPQPRRRKKETK